MSKSFIFSAVALTDMTGKEGLGVKSDGLGNVALADGTTDEITGVIVQGDVAGQQVAIALPGATVPVKVSGSVKAFDAGKIAADATFVKSALAQNDVIAVRFLEAGVSGDSPMGLILPAVKHA